MPIKISDLPVAAVFPPVMGPEVQGGLISDILLCALYKCIGDAMVYSGIRGAGQEFIGEDIMTALGLGDMGVNNGKVEFFGQFFCTFKKSRFPVHKS